MIIIITIWLWLKWWKWWIQCSNLDRQCWWSVHRVSLSLGYSLRICQLWSSSPTKTITVRVLKILTFVMIILITHVHTIFNYCMISWVMIELSLRWCHWGLGEEGQPGEIELSLMLSLRTWNLQMFHYHLQHLAKLKNLCQWMLKQRISWRIDLCRRPWLQLHCQWVWSTTWTFLDRFGFDIWWDQ